MKTVSESIFDGEYAVIPMADVSHVEKHWYDTDKKRTKTNYRGILIITKHTKYNFEKDTWENNLYLGKEEAERFLKAWCMYRHELENDTLKDLTI